MAWLFYHSPVGGELCSTLPKCIQVNMISLMSAKMKKKTSKNGQKVSFFASFLHHHCCPLQPSQPKPSQAKQKPKTKIIIVFQNKKGNEYLRIHVTRVYEPKVNEFLFRMKKVKRRRKKMLLKKYDDDWSRYDNDLCGIYRIQLIIFHNSYQHHTIILIKPKK